MSTEEQLVKVKRTVYCENHSFHSILKDEFTPLILFCMLASSSSSASCLIYKSTKTWIIGLGMDEADMMGTRQTEVYL